MIGRRTVSNTNYTIVRADAYVGVIGLAQPIILTLPDASAYPPGQPLYIADETGNCSADLTITIAPAAGQSIVGSDSVSMVVGGQKLTFHSNGTNLWTVA